MSSDLTKREGPAPQGRTGCGHRGWEGRVGVLTKAALEGHTGATYRSQLKPSSVPLLPAAHLGSRAAGLRPCAPESLGHFPGKWGGSGVGRRPVRFLLKPGPWAHRGQPWVFMGPVVLKRLQKSKPAFPLLPARLWITLSLDRGRQILVLQPPPNMQSLSPDGKMELNSGQQLTGSLKTHPSLCTYSLELCTLLGARHGAACTVLGNSFPSGHEESLL